MESQRFQHLLESESSRAAEIVHSEVEAVTRRCLKFPLYLLRNLQSILSVSNSTVDTHCTDIFLHPTFYPAACCPYPNFSSNCLSIPDRHPWSYFSALHHKMLSYFRSNDDQNRHRQPILDICSAWNTWRGAVNCVHHVRHTTSWLSWR